MIAEPLSSRALSENDQAPTARTRKYRKHPKADQNAPKKPAPSAYHLFAFDQGKLLREEGLTFEEIAKETGSRWRALRPKDIRKLEAETVLAKTQYKEDVAAYEHTPEHTEYQKYLKKWMAKEDMKSQKLDRRSRRRLTPPPPRKDNRFEQDTGNDPEIPSDIADWTPSDLNLPNAKAFDFGPSSEEFGQGLPYHILAASYMPSLWPTPADTYLSSSWPMPSQGMSTSWGTGTELSTADQMTLRWLSDIETTLAPDPLFPSKPIQQTGSVPMLPMTNSTISPVMLCEPYSSPEI